MCGRILNWLVGQWQWPYAALFTAAMLTALAPFVFGVAGLALGLVFLQIPIYMVHQYEEHAGDRFRRWVNQHIGHGREVLTPIATFWINSLLVWLVDIVALYLACYVDLSLGLIAFYLPMLNAVAHIVPTVVTRQYNPGVITAVLLFLPVGIVSTYLLSQAAGSELHDHLVALGAAIGIHATIIVHVRRRIAMLSGVGRVAAAA